MIVAVEIIDYQDMGRKKLFEEGDMENFTSNNNLGLIHDATQLRKLIAENPDLPIVVLASDDCNSGDYAWMYCSSVTCAVDELLDVSTPYNDEVVFTDRDDFESCVSDCLWNDETMKLSDADYEAMVQAEVAKYDPYWRKVIAVYCSN